VASQNLKRGSFYAASVFLILLLKACNISTQVRNEGIIAEGPTEDYAGSNSCKGCHRGKYEDWSGRLMSNFVRYRSDVSEPLPGNWDNSPIREEDVFLIVGVKRKVAFVDNNWKVFPYQYHLGKQKWMERSGWAGHDYRLRCGVCHTVGLDPKTRRFTELNVGCEACHGPGKIHAGNPIQKKMKVPGKTDGHHVLFTCRRCHNERGRHTRAIKLFSGVFHSSED